ncbi:hypothetical protein DACRYDRAFT_115366 [Dacryopinax primogenitus]|uniref:Uncharacterized protein n=1 Tax=Dacryopinax primogenitus (strain DJM 731) TaxID=1858805 RepID=M5G333_DACPD|nr:uncharacterized protein DACRYDRAFT_115366 [Dacryopinax primogenitus]EJU03109.1 hypothetical protein DACRYDRAFT_115366 [Dacryopinax primogenitus]
MSLSWDLRETLFRCLRKIQTSLCSVWGAIMLCIRRWMNSTLGFLTEPTSSPLLRPRVIGCMSSTPLFRCLAPGSVAAQRSASTMVSPRQPVSCNSWMSSSQPNLDTSSIRTRSTCPALYLGVWHRSNSVPFVTADSRQQKQTTRRAMVRLMFAVNQEVGPRVLQLLGARYPDVARERQEIIEHTWTHPNLWDKPDLAGCHHYLWQVAWTTLAVRCGSGNVVHINVKDDLHQFTVLFTYGSYTMGYFIIPQLNICIPLQPGQLLFVKTCYLVHYVSHFEGVSYVFTGFMDGQLCNDYWAWRDSQ